MAALGILMDAWPLVCGLVLSLLGGAAWGWRTLSVDRAAACRLAERVDRARASTKPAYKLIQRPHGAFKAAVYIFVVNLLGGSLLRFSLGGVFVLPPFLFLIALGRLLVLTLARYEERSYVAFRFPVVPFEVAALIVAAVGGTRIGINVWSMGGVGSTLTEWAILFGTLVIPLQLIGAVLEGVAMHRLYVVKGEPLPEKAVSAEDDQGAPGERI